LKVLVLGGTGSIDQRMSSDKARHDLGWKPVRTDPVADVS
jgi:hypothetical protein